MTTLLLVADVPKAETPAQHVRNALMVLSLLQETVTATWVLNPELGRAMRRAEAGLVILEHHGPPALAASNVRSAIESILEADMDWQVVPEIPHVMERLFVAWFALLRDV